MKAAILLGRSAKNGENGRERPGHQRLKKRMAGARFHAGHYEKEKITVKTIK